MIKFPKRTNGRTCAVYHIDIMFNSFYTLFVGQLGPHLIPNLPGDTISNEETQEAASRSGEVTQSLSSAHF